MPEAIVYVNNSFHTGLVREATYELLEGGLRVVDICVDTVGQLKEILGVREVSPAVLNRLLTPTNMPVTARKKWRVSEKWVGRFLTDAKLNPEVGVPVLPKKDLAEPIPLTETIRLADYFFQSRRDQMKILFNDKGFSNLNSLIWARQAYLESRMLRRAIYEGYLIIDEQRLTRGYDMLSS